MFLLKALVLPSSITSKKNYNIEITKIFCSNKYFPRALSLFLLNSLL